MALSANTSRDYSLGDINEFGVKASAVIYEGSAVGSSGGYARALTAGDQFLGFAIHAATGLGSDGLVNVRVKAKGAAQLAVTSVAVTDIGKPVYASDDGTFTLTATSNSHIGTVQRFVSTGIAIVSFDATNPAKTSGITALTDNSGGVAVDGTIAAVTDATTSADAIKELATKLNEVINALK